MKKYYVHYYNNFGNTYNLYWTDSPDMEKNLPDGAKRISRKETISLCVQEKYARKHDQNFSGYAMTAIYPADYDFNDCIENDSRYYLDGYVWNRK